VAAHEIGHYLGLWHTVESFGQHDFIDDTLECPASGPGGPCATAGGGYLMHWQAVGGTTITNGQGRVIRGHPLLAPAGYVTGKPTAKPVAPVPDPEDLEALGPGWCGTCKDCASGRVK
jgi:hypothetical protein